MAAEGSQLRYKSAEFLRAEVRIGAWLDDVRPDSPPLPNPSPPRSPVQCKRKRPLNEMSNNIGTPAKVARTSLPQKESNQDPDQTPRPRLQPLGSDKPHGSPVEQPDQGTASPSTSASSSQISGSSVASRKRKRGGSPSKKMAGLRYAKYATRQERFGRLTDLPSHVRELASTMQRLGRGVGVLANHHQNWLPELGDGEPDDWAMFLEDEERRKLGQVPDLEIVRRIMRHAQRNDMLGCSETTWNNNVHSTLLDEAWNGSAHRNEVRWDSITTAAIEPQDLVPELTQRERVQSKKVDFAISLELGEEAERHLAQANIQLNQTTYEGVRYNPIVVSIETKTSGDGGSEGKLQLATWTSSQITKLRELLALAGNPDADIPPLPLIMIQGHDWQYLCLEDCKELAWFRSGIAIGSTTKLLAGYQIIAALQYLMHWAQTVYRPWFETQILTPILASIRVTI